MKRIIIVFVSLLLMVCLLACGNSETEESVFVDIEIQDEINATDEAEKVPVIEEMPANETTTVLADPVFVYEDEMFTLHYMGNDVEILPSLIFKVVNKSEQDIGFCFDSIAVNGVTEYPAFIVEVLAGTEGEYWCDVSTVDGLETLTANICITDSDGYTIKECSLKEVPLS